MHKIKKLYLIHAVINKQVIENKVLAYTEKQALYFFRERNGYKCRDLKCIGIISNNINKKYEQIKFAI